MVSALPDSGGGSSDGPVICKMAVCAFLDSGGRGSAGSISWIKCDNVCLSGRVVEEEAVMDH